MFGLEFLFSAAFLAIPVIGLPVVLHLLFRRKSPVIPFSTLRFIKASIQRTAARRRVHRWLLLATRMLLIALLIWAVAQPARMLASSWFGGGGGAVAAIVVDDSASMRLRDGQTPLLKKADSAVGELLRGPLSSARLAVYTSKANPEREQLRSAPEIQAGWRELSAEPADRPLADRIDAATAMLKAQNATDKWLIVLSDLQSREFPRPMSAAGGMKVVLIDLHPDEARSAGVAKIALEPPQPIPGIETQAVVTVAGRPGDGRALSLKLSTPDGRTLAQTPAKMSHIESEGRIEVRFPIQLPAERWVRVTASLQGEDAMEWDDSRSLLVEIPPRREVTLLEGGAPASAMRFTALALDPNEGALAGWPVRVKPATDISGEESMVVAPLGRWPNAVTAERLAKVVERGGTVVLMLQPGLESFWTALPAEQKSALGKLLPGTPASVAAPAGKWGAEVASAESALFRGLGGVALPTKPIEVGRLVGFDSLFGDTKTLLSAGPMDAATARAGAKGLVFERPLGAGTVYTVATLPDRSFTDLPMHPAFLPMLVRMSLPSGGQSLAKNGEIGERIEVRPATAADKLEIATPGGGRYETPRDGSGAFGFDRTDETGLYQWVEVGGQTPVAMADVRGPSAESELEYRDAKQVAPEGDSVIVVRSYGELEKKLTAFSEPQPKWSTPIALVLILLCAEAALGAGFRVKG